ncbi:iron-sulfur cluster repair di-iron protein [Desulfosporosinus sp. Sb-LF]|uniref:iron-sulfur cluster repair di-iron protein n=1 Tax=Desulfosporosinus sp. Sb-LF TaxID=2560027 RepID=UPI00107FA734|nr:iron-sulfur cluster repair di-iron protein [Desulfosporosinus sp. Sb-LF]TGE31750.1 iron-sulfur cluster repair di-iron protein [Desulfosporosinus sp. Sb-LF]
MFTTENRIGDIVAQFPKSADVLKAYSIDFCCGGDRPLAEALKEKNLDDQEVLTKINQMYVNSKNIKSKDTDWTKATLATLTDHIVQKHHRYLNEELPKISEYVTRILNVHGDHHPELKQVNTLFHKLKDELEEHLVKEEQIEFPLIKAYEENPSHDKLNRALIVMGDLEKEHVGAGDILKELQRITDNFKIPADGCNSYGLTYAKLSELMNDTFQHIHLENNILFPRLKAKQLH